MQSKNDEGEPTLACDFTVMDTEQRERYRALRRRLSKDLHEARELEDGYAFRHSSEAEVLIALAEYVTLGRMCCPFFDFTIEVGRDEGKFLRRYVARHIGKGLALGVPAIGASLATLAASVTARRITAPGPRDKKFVTPWELAVPHEDVIFRTEDGLLLRGWWLASPEAKRTVITLHGHRGARHHCVGMAAALWRRGANVLLFDHRGRGSSEGKSISLGHFETVDVSAAIGYALSSALSEQVVSDELQ